MKISEEGTFHFVYWSIHMNGWIVDMEGANFPMETINGHARTGCANHAQRLVIAAALIHIGRQVGVDLRLPDGEQMPELIDIEAERVAREWFDKFAQKKPKRPWWRVWGTHA